MKRRWNFWVAPFRLTKILPLHTIFAATNSWSTKITRTGVNVSMRLWVSMRITTMLGGVEAISLWDRRSFPRQTTVLVRGAKLISVRPSCGPTEAWLCRIVTKLGKRWSVLIRQKNCSQNGLWPNTKKSPCWCLWGAIRIRSKFWKNSRDLCRKRPPFRLWWAKYTKSRATRQKLWQLLTRLLNWIPKIRTWSRLWSKNCTKLTTWALKMRSECEKN